MKVRWCYLVSLVVVFYFPNQALGQVIVSEVTANPVTGSEWVELYNPSEQEVSLANWQIKDELSSPSLVWQFSTELLQPDSFLVVTLPTAKLNNSGDAVTLTNATGQLVDRFSYTFSQSGLSWQRINLMEPIAVWKELAPTPNAHPPTSIPSPSPSSSPSPPPSVTPSPYPSPPTTEIRLNEIMACPESQFVEWVELARSSDSTLTISNWSLVDLAGNSHFFSIDFNDQNLAVVPLSNAILNNSGDSLFLFDSSSQLLHQARFGSCNPGSSFIYTNGEWLQTLQPTMGLPNILSMPDSSPFPSSTPPAVSPSASISAATTSSIVSDHNSSGISTILSIFDTPSDYRARRSEKKDQVLLHSTSFMPISDRKPSSHRSSPFILTLLGCGALLSLSYTGYNQVKKFRVLIATQKQEDLLRELVQTTHSTSNHGTMLK